MPDGLHKPNWLLRGLILLSVGVHLLLLMHMAQLYRPKDISRIELTLRQALSHFQREIPKPRPRLKPFRDPQEQTVAEAFDEPYTPPKPLQYAMPAPIDSNRLTEKNQIPRTPVIEDTGVAEWQDDPATFPVAAPSISDDVVMTERAYTNLVQKQIEAIALRQYPPRARRRNAQGVVEIEFTIGIKGELSHISIVKSSGERDLDRAAIGAAKEASPFASPPKGPMTIRLPISYRLV
jgi:protein TonB